MKTSIVKFNGVLFLTREDDFRFGTDHYQTVTSARNARVATVGRNGAPCATYIGADGKNYHVFADGSAVEVG